MSKYIPQAIEVKWDGDEPYLSPPTHPDIRITPYRRDYAEDAKCLSAMNSAPGVGKWAHGKANPFTLEHARERFDSMLGPQEAAIAQLRTDPSSLYLNPFSVIRNAEGRYIGDLGIFPHEAADDDADTSKRTSKTERRAKEGDTWRVAYSLDPEFWGQGIATAAVGAVLAWARDALGVRKVEATENLQSSRLMEKLGFEKTEVRTLEWPAHHGGGMREVTTWYREL